MSIAASKAVWDQSESTGAARLVMLCLAEYTNDTKRVCWPSVATIANATKVSERQVKRALKELQEMGEIRRIEDGLGRGNTAVYTILLDVDWPIKGDKVSLNGVTMSPNSQPIKGDISSLNGDMVSKKVTFDTVKGDKVSPEPLYNHYEPLEPEEDSTPQSPLQELSRHFTETSGILPSNSSYKKDWEPILQRWLDNYRDSAKDKITAAISFAKGNNDNGKLYTIVSPRSIDNIMANLGVNLNGNGSTAVTLWDSQVTPWRNGSVPFASLDTAVQDAIRHIGGDGLVKADSYTINEAKKQFLVYMGKHETSNGKH